MPADNPQPQIMMAPPQQVVPQQAPAGNPAPAAPAAFVQAAFDTGKFIA